MKRKYYMRGLGIGVLVTAVIFAVASPKQKVAMTDEEVIARAQELGYVKDEGGVTPEDINKIKDNEKMTGTPAVSEEPEGTPNVTEEPEGTPGPTLSPVPTPEPPNPPDKPDEPTVPATPTPSTTKVTEAPKATATPKPTATLRPTATPTPTKNPGVTSGTVRVERGMTATKVAGLLVEIGAVNDAADFVAYLRKNNLTDFINIGTFTIPQGASYEEIAGILTK